MAKWSRKKWRNSQFGAWSVERGALEECACELHMLLSLVPLTGACEEEIANRGHCTGFAKSLDLLRTFGRLLLSHAF